MRDPKIIEMINKNYIEGAMRRNTSISKTALFAIDYKGYLEENKNYTLITDQYGDDDYSLYVFNPKMKVYQLFEEISFKKNFIDYLSEAFTPNENSAITDLRILFSDADLYNIYELIKVYSEYGDFDIFKYADNGHLITNINNELFDVDTHSFIEWKDEYIDSCPIMYQFEFDGTRDDVVKFFNDNNITQGKFEDFINLSDIEDKVTEGYSEFDLVDTMSDVLEDFIKYDEDEEENYDE